MPSEASRRCLVLAGRRWSLKNRLTAQWADATASEGLAYTMGMTSAAVPTCALPKTCSRLSAYDTF